MPYLPYFCSNRFCYLCFPPGEEERSVLNRVIDNIEQEIRTATTHAYDASDGTRYIDHGMDCHPDFHEPWFLPLANAYEAGMKRALQEVRDVLAYYEPKGH